MVLFITNGTAIAMAASATGRVDAGPAGGMLNIYGGTVPADADASLGGATLLATLTFSDPAFGAPVDANPGATATANAITGDSAADATGTASFFRITDSNGAVVMQGSVGVTGSGQELELNSTAIQVGIAVEVTSLTVTMPES